MKFRIILEKTPIGVGFGIQIGKGNQYEIDQFQMGNGQDLNFECSAQVKKNSTGALDFYGLTIQGPTKERFIYINIGTSAGQIGSNWTRRLKVPLRGIAEEMVLVASQNETCYLETRVPALGKDGTPNCATVKPFGGWSLQNTEGEIL